MLILLNTYIKNGIIFNEYSLDGVSISHVEQIRHFPNTPEPVPNSLTLEKRVEEVENTLNYIILGGI